MLLLISFTIILNTAFCSSTSVNSTNTPVVQNNTVNYTLVNGTNNELVSTSSANNTAENICGTQAPMLVNGLTVDELKEGLSRIQIFYNENGKLPNSVSYGTRHIPLATFEQNIATQGWKISTPPITTNVALLANSLTWNTNSQYAKAVDIFDWVRDNIQYSYYDGTKYGAAGTLKYRSGNCCDTANLIVALARDAGLNACYTYGYCQFSSGEWFYHMWADIDVNGKWYIADAISPKNSLGIIKNWNTANFQLMGSYNVLPY